MYNALIRLHWSSGRRDVLVSASMNGGHRWFCGRKAVGRSTHALKRERERERSGWMWRMGGGSATDPGSTAGVASWNGRNELSYFLSPAIFHPSAQSHHSPQFTNVITHTSVCVLAHLHPTARVPYATGHKWWQELRSWKVEKLVSDNLVRTSREYHPL